MTNIKTNLGMWDEFRLQNLSMVNLMVFTRRKWPKKSVIVTSVVEDLPSRGPKQTEDWRKYISSMSFMTTHLPCRNIWNTHIGQLILLHPEIILFYRVNISENIKMCLQASKMSKLCFTDYYIFRKSMSNSWNYCNRSCHFTTSVLDIVIWQQ